jgi:hypothetical protein
VIREIPYSERSFVLNRLSAYLENFVRDSPLHHFSVTVWLSGLGEEESNVLRRMALDGHWNLASIPMLGTRTLHAEHGMHCEGIPATLRGSLASNRQEAKSVHGEALQPFIFRKSEMTALECLDVSLNR